MVDQSSRTTRFSFIILLSTVSLTTISCSRFTSIFYNQKKPQALQRDTLTLSGELRSWIDYADYKENGVIKLATVEFLPSMDSVLVQVPDAAGLEVAALKQPRKLYLPSGFSAEVYAWNLGKPSGLVLRDDGTLFVSDIEGGRILAIPKGGSPTIIADGLATPHGMEFVDGSLYYTDETHVYRFDFSSPTSIEGTSTQLTDGIKKGGDFYTRTIRYRPSDNSFYISVGATNANGEERDRDHAIILRMKKEGERPKRLFKVGLRNTMGMDIHPVTGDVWGIDQGMDDLAEQLAPEEVNILTGEHSAQYYGHPYYYSQNYRNPKFSDYKDTDPRLPENPKAPVIELQPYSLPTDMRFYTNDALGPEWKNAMIIVYKGYVISAVSRPNELRTGFKVVRVRSNNDGTDPYQADFISGWIDEKGDFWGRPVGITWSKEGKTFFVSDEKNSVVYKFVAP